MSTLTIDDPAYFATLSERDALHWWHSAMWRIAAGWLDGALRGKSGLQALDIGCGAGGMIRRLSQRTEIAQVLGIDPSPSAIAHAVDLDVAIGSALSVPFPDRSLDLACSFDVLQHLPSGEDCTALLEMARVLRVGGIALLRTNGEGLWPDRSRVDRPYDLARLKNAVRSTGLEVVAATYANCLPSVATEIVGRARSAFGSSKTHGHPQGGGLRAHQTGQLDALMRAISTAEAFAITRLRLKMPVGHSCMVLARKPTEVRP